MGNSAVGFTAWDQAQARATRDVGRAAPLIVPCPPYPSIPSGALAVQMRDGSVQEFTTNDVMLLPPGHDAWTIGDEPFVFVEFSRGNDYYAEPAGT